MSFFAARRNSGSGGRNVLLTGITRSGTTLSCHLLNRVPDVVALHEPMDVSKYFGVTDATRIGRITERWCASTRKSLIRRGVAIARHVDGHVPEDTISAEPGANGLRRPIGVRGPVEVSPRIAHGFTLVVKHPAAFTALLEQLAPRYPVFAIVRNPLSVLSSWSSIDIAVRDGRSPVAETLDPALGAALDGLADRLSRQLHLLNWFFARYLRLLEPSAVLRYEDVVATGGSSLAAAVPEASTLAADLTSRNLNPAYARETMDELGGRLLADDGPWRMFYGSESIEALLR